MPTDSHHTQRAASIIKTIRYATVATVNKSNEPWNSPVCHVYDDELNIYWFSDKQGQHSQNVNQNPNVFIAIYDSTVPEGQGEGVYIQAQAIELNDPAGISVARRIKKGADDDSPDDFMGTAVRRVYKAVPKCIWVNDAQIKNGKFIRDFRVEINKSELTKLL